MNPQVVVAVDGLSEEGKARIRDIAHDAAADVAFRAESDSWSDHLLHTEIAFGAPPAKLLASSNLRFLQLHSSGYEPYKLPALQQHPTLTIANARGVTAQAVAEHTLAMMFALTRRLPKHIRDQREHLWQRAATYEVLHGATVCIVGVGAIGGALATMCSGIGMHVLGVQRSASKLDCVERTFPMHLLQEALKRSRHVVVTLPSLPLSQPLIGTHELNAMQDGSFLYSVSRASLIDYDAVFAALTARKLAGVGLDVFPVEPLPRESPLWRCEDVLITPHAGGRFEGEMDALATLFADNLSRYFSGQPLRNVVMSKEKVSN